MEPIISHRCPDCGAAARPGAAYCPQCGFALKAGTGQVGKGPSAAAEAPARTSTEPQMRAAQAAPPPAPPSPANASDVALSGQGGARDGGGVVKAQPTPPAQADKDERGRRQRISAATRDAVETRIGPRVEKLRHASNVVLEEASYDPSLRFVLIAVAIFLASMLLLLLNHILG